MTLPVHTKCTKAQHDIKIMTAAASSLDVNWKNCNLCMTLQSLGCY